MRFRPSERFIQQVLKADSTVQNRIFAALKKLGEEHKRKGINLEPFRGRPGFYTARVTRGLRLLLREAEDEGGRYMIIERFGSHDEIY